MLHLIHSFSLNNLFFDLINFIILLIVYFSIYKLKIIDNKIFIIIIGFTLTPFLINYFLIDWYQMPDQAKYFKSLNNLRTDLILPTDIKPSVKNSAVVYFFFPLPIVETINSVSFFNKGIYVLILIWLYSQKYIDKFLLILLLVFPSVLFYSSLSLKDTLSLIMTVLLSSIMIRSNNYFLAIISIFIIYLIKPANAFLLIPIFTIYFLYIKKEDTILTTLFLIIVLTITIIYLDPILKNINGWRIGMFAEAGLNSSNFEKISLSPSIFKVISKDLIRFLISPYPKIYSFMGFIQMLENIFLFLLLFNFFKKLYFFNKKKFYFWLTSFLFMILPYSVIVFSEGTTTRYKFVILIFIFQSIYVEILNAKKIRN